MQVIKTGEKSNFSQFTEKTGQEDTKREFGKFRGKFELSDDFDSQETNQEIAVSFEGE